MANEVGKSSIDTASGIVTSENQDFVFVDGALALVVGDPVAPHPPCPLVPIHCTAVMAEGSSFVTINGIPVCVTNDLATCGHALTGTSHVQIIEP